jgi:hypothetical protein
LASAKRWHDKGVEHPHHDQEPVEVDYVLPIRAGSLDGVVELTQYLRWLKSVVRRVVVVDGSDDRTFVSHAEAWGDATLHIRPDPDLTFRNGKVNGVLTGLRRCTASKVIIGDDDIRYDHRALVAVAAALDHGDIVRPQNYFDPLPWHAQWDTARTLINRALGGDYPGTLALRPAILSSGGYDGNVLFENLELIRTVRARGGIELIEAGLFIRRRPPSSRHFVHQRRRQAYDSFAQPRRYAAELLLLPALIVSVRRARAIVAAFAVAAMVVAEYGRRRSSGRQVLAASAVLWAPVWVGERAICAWLALVSRVAYGGIKYGDVRLRIAAHSLHWLRSQQGAIVTGDSVDLPPAVAATQDLHDQSGHAPPAPTGT